MTFEPATADRIPFRRLVLMPWRWSRWVRCFLIFAALVGYVMAEPLSRIFVYGYLDATPTISYVRRAFFLPVITAAERCPPIAAFIQWEDDLVSGFLGNIHELGFWRAVKILILREIFGVKGPL